MSSRCIFGLLLLLACLWPLRMPPAEPAMERALQVLESSHALQSAFLKRTPGPAGLSPLRPGRTNCGLQPARSTFAQDLPIFSTRTGNEGWSGVQRAGPGLRPFSTCLPPPGCA